ncbi:hypothetical protein CBI38_00245 [Rhodococcus oxybenzonivorans]|uniref:Uncharacterized protein n=1 Tax=Rhodococcus oxybenzonivorans TaxID=1990687 RepID=A0A2S2BNN5_9NOCA|nr:type VII secretion target [Rhodococcus oxybenzonivorans]AWK70237.1 hypothetical protein CBI38_00245 [Rhodococcus oxybenzonivorans]
MGEQLEVDPAVLVQAAQGINAITESLAGLGIGETAAVGRGFSLLALSPMEAGKQEVQSSLEEFAERWSWGVRYLVQAANDIARNLDLAAGRYHATEQAYSNALKTMWTNTVGNPHLSGEEISERTWGETLADNPVNQTLNPDYSLESFAAADRTIATNNEVISAVGPQALANVSPLGDMLDSESTAAWNTDGADEAAAIMSAGGPS